MYLHVRSERAGDAVARLADLASIVETALLVDPTRGGLCCDLPDGRATEIGPLVLPRDERDPGRQSSLAPAAPTAEAALDVRCRWETDNSGERPTIRIDDATLFASGPAWLTVGAWPRQTVQRNLAGRNAEVVLDLGRRSRTLQQTGRLRAKTPEAVAELVEAVETLIDGMAHTLTDANGLTYDNVVVERFAPAGPLTRQRVFELPYEITYRQLP